MSNYNRLVRNLFQPPPVDGEIGLEIEVEGKNIPQGNFQYHWNGHLDNSLRQYEGHQPQEFTLRKPVTRDDLTKVLTYFSRHLNKSGAEPVMGQRTSVHVHLNCQDLTFKQVCQILTVWYIFEELLVEYSGGKERAGNLFCLRAMDAENVLRVLEEAIRRDNPRHVLQTESLKYHAVNISTLGHFGSLEFRSHKGTVDPARIEAWVRMLLSIKDWAVGYDDPHAIVGDFSVRGPVGFLQYILPDFVHQIYYLPKFEQRMWNGLRLAQDIAWSTPLWSTEIPPEKEKPFGRKTTFSEMMDSQQAVLQQGARTARLRPIRPSVTLSQSIWSTPAETNPNTPPPQPQTPDETNNPVAPGFVRVDDNHYIDMNTGGTITATQYYLRSIARMQQATQAVEVPASTAVDSEFPEDEEFLNTLDDDE